MNLEELTEIKKAAKEDIERAESIGQNIEFLTNLRNNGSGLSSALLKRQNDTFHSRANLARAYMFDIVEEFGGDLIRIAEMRLMAEQRRLKRSGELKKLQVNAYLGD